MDSRTRALSAPPVSFGAIEAHLQHFKDSRGPRERFELTRRPVYMETPRRRSFGLPGVLLAIWTFSINALLAHCQSRRLFILCVAYPQARPCSRSHALAGVPCTLTLGVNPATHACLRSDLKGALHRNSQSYLQECGNMSKHATTIKHLASATPVIERHYNSNVVAWR